MHTRSDRPAGTQPPRLGRHGMALAVLALHALLAAGLWQALRWRTVSVPREHPALVWVQPVVPALPALPPGEQARPPAPPRPTTASLPRPAPPVVAVPPHESTWVTPAEPAPLAAAAPASAASAAPEGRLMDSAATRAAIRQIGKQPLLQERAAAATQMPIERTDTALARGVAESSVPDCMKDPAAASGQIGPIALGGILGLPFLAARVVTGKCAK